MRIITTNPRHYWVSNRNFRIKLKVEYPLQKYTLTAANNPISHSVYSIHNRKLIT